MFGSQPLMTFFAAATLLGAVVAAIMGALVFLALPQPATRAGRLGRTLARVVFNLLVAVGLIVGLIGLYVAL